MKLAVCTNFAQPFHTGGAERIVQQITEHLVSVGHSCTVFSQHGKSQVTHNGVTVCPIGSFGEEQFIHRMQIENFDHLFVYSDWFFMWPVILKNIVNLPMKKSIALVGMNRMRSVLPQNKVIADLFRKNHASFSVLAHAKNYIDAVTCEEWGIPVSIIHNSIDLNEFVKTDFDFKQHYGIKTPKMLLCVSNFFPGKGQEFLPGIIQKLASKHKDFTFVFISSTLAFEPGNRLRTLVKDMCDKKGLPVKFLNDIPRSHVVQSYFACDGFVFPSQQECGPIVVLEAMAAGKPWVALGVGHIPELKGGFFVESPIDSKGMMKFDMTVARFFEDKMASILADNLIRNRNGEGRKNIEESYNWDIIKKQYEDFFSVKM
jgi:glycosyltransferase involved in cell wall biosynthesis